MSAIIADIFFITAHKFGKNRNAHYDILKNKISDKGASYSECYVYYIMVRCIYGGEPYAKRDDSQQGCHPPWRPRTDGVYESDQCICGMQWGHCCKYIGVAAIQAVENAKAGCFIKSAKTGNVARCAQYEIKSVRFTKRNTMAKCRYGFTLPPK